jgi:hypothetical protein
VAAAEAQSPAEFDAGVSKLAASRVAIVVVIGDAMFVNERVALAASALKEKLPTAHKDGAMQPHEQHGPEPEQPKPGSKQTKLLPFVIAVPPMGAKPPSDKAVSGPSRCAAEAIGIAERVLPPNHRDAYSPGRRVRIHADPRDLANASTSHQRPLHRTRMLTIPVWTH